jgi:hypothetical protein
MTLPKSKPQRKPKPAYWRIIQLLRSLRLRYRERNKGEKTFHITIDDFGIMLRFNPRQPTHTFTGWDIVDVNMETYENNPPEFGQNLIWLLISKGYFAYLRSPDMGHPTLFRRLLIKEGWALRIIDKRLELYDNLPKHKFMIEHNKRLRALSISYILTYYPDFFDYLW